MQDQDPTSIIDRDPRFHALQRVRSRFAWSLAALVLACFYSFMLIIAYRPAWFAAPLHAGTTITFGIASGLAMIGVSILLTGLYVWRANREFDRLNQQILDDAHHAAR